MRRTIRRTRDLLPDKSDGAKEAARAVSAGKHPRVPFCAILEEELDCLEHKHRLSGDIVWQRRTNNRRDVERHGSCSEFLGVAAYSAPAPSSRVCNSTWAQTMGLCSGAFGARAPERRTLSAEIAQLALEFLRQFPACVGDDFHRSFAQHRGHRGIAFLAMRWKASITASGWRVAKRLFHRLRFGGSPPVLVVRFRSVI
jgi:hypothetical protein